jgi:nucleotide-binding universal stress UspA family protein
MRSVISIHSSAGSHCLGALTFAWAISRKTNRFVSGPAIFIMGILHIRRKKSLLFRILPAAFFGQVLALTLVQRVFEAVSGVVRLRALLPMNETRRTPMGMFRHILFPVDFSERSAQTVPYVRDMAQHMVAHVTLLNIVTPLWYPAGPMEAGGVPIPSVREIEEDRREQLRHFADTYFGDSGTPLDVATVSMIGDAGIEIVQYAKEHNVDLIMMPTHGYGPFRRFLLGSITAKVLHDAECAVWTTPHSEVHPEFPPDHQRVVLGAVNLEPESLAVIKATCRLAQTFGATPHLVHVISGDLSPENIKYQTKTALEKFSDFQKAAGTAFEEKIQCGPLTEKLRLAATNCHADLLVIGRNHPGRLRSKVYTIVRDTPCPVLSV